MKRVIFKKIFSNQLLAALMVILTQICVSAYLAHGEENNVEKKSDKIFDLDEIVVTGTPIEKPIFDVTIETRLITREGIKNSNAQTISDLLKYIPGIGTGFGGGADDRPGRLDWRANFRGLMLDHGQGLILVDGQRIKGSGMGDGGYGLNQLPVEMIERRFFRKKVESVNL